MKRIPRNSVLLNGPLIVKFRFNGSLERIVKVQNGSKLRLSSDNNGLNGLISNRVDGHMYKNNLKSTLRLNTRPTQRNGRCLSIGLLTIRYCVDLMKHPPKDEYPKCAAQKGTLWCTKQILRCFIFVSFVLDKLEATVCSNELRFHSVQKSKQVKRQLVG